MALAFRPHLSELNCSGVFSCSAFCFNFPRTRKVSVGRRWTTPSVLQHYIICFSLSHETALLESDVRPFLNGGSDHLRFPLSALSSRRLAVFGSKSAAWQDVNLPTRHFCCFREKCRMDTEVWKLNVCIAIILLVDY